MTTIKCRECGSAVSDTADACPQCGALKPGNDKGELAAYAKQQYHVHMFLVVVIIAFMIYTIFFT